MIICRRILLNPGKRGKCFQAFFLCAIFFSLCYWNFVQRSQGCNAKVTAIGEKDTSCFRRIFYRFTSSEFMNVQYYLLLLTENRLPIHNRWKIHAISDIRISTVFSKNTYSHTSQIIEPITRFKVGTAPNHYTVYLTWRAGICHGHLFSTIYILFESGT